MNREPNVTELWAVTAKDGSILWSRGGSSTKPHLLVYPSKQSAERALKSIWTKQVINPDEVDIKLIYTTTEIKK